MNTQSHGADTSLEPAKSIADELRDIMAQLSGIDPGKIALTSRFAEVGIDAMALARVRHVIAEKYGVSMKLRQLGEEIGTIDGLSSYLTSRVAEGPHGPAPAPGSNSRTQLTAPSTTRGQEYLQEFIRRYETRTRGSKALAQRYRAVLADRRSATGFKFSTKEIVYPIAATRSHGARFWDVDGNEYVDIIMGFGTLLFGHRPPFIVAAIERQLEKGIHVGPQSELAGQVAELVCELSGMERVAFTVTGSEAVMVALRLARTRTGRSKVVMFQHAFHGGYDGTLMADDLNAAPGTAVPACPGIPPALAGDVMVLDYGNPQSLEIIDAVAHELAAVLVEPVQSSRPSLQPREFLHELRRITRRADVALIFDEVITGFRIGLRGAQDWFGVSADLVTYGKAVGGGHPIGIVAGGPAYLDAVDGGFWRFGDQSYPNTETTWVGWTYGKHPLSMAVAHAVLSRMKTEGRQLLERLNQRTKEFAERLNRYFETAGAPIHVSCFASLFRFECPQNADLFFYHLVNKGVYVTDLNRVCFLSTAHTDDDLDHVMAAVRESVEAMQTAGFLRTAGRDG